MEKDFGVKVNWLRNRNGGEYMSDAFFKYCDDNGILRQMACHKNPQKNGVSEMKLAHLASTSLSCLHDKNLPQELWAEATKCACYVINHLSPWSGSKIPFRDSKS